MTKILLIEDDLEFAQLIKNFLTSKNILTTICDDAFHALVMELELYDLVLLDLGLEGMDGLEVCQEFRKKSNIPIIISTARGSVSDKILGLGIGADDYLPKPYDPDELYARIISLIRRTKLNNSSPTTEMDFQVDDKISDVRYKNNPLLLTQAEFEVFSFLIRSHDAILSKEQLIENSYSISSSDGKSLEMIISKIRQKIKHYSPKNHIMVLRGRGYRFVE